VFYFAAVHALLRGTSLITFFITVTGHTMSKTELNTDWFDEKQTCFIFGGRFLLFFVLHNPT